MSALLLTLALLLEATAGHVTVVESRVPHGVVPAAGGWRECQSSFFGHHATLTFTATADDRVRVWEYQGARDCIDDGVFNGSTMPDCDVAFYLSQYPEARMYDDYLTRAVGEDERRDLIRSECVSAMVTDFGKELR